MRVGPVLLVIFQAGPEIVSVSARALEVEVEAQTSSSAISQTRQTCMPAQLRGFASRRARRDDDEGAAPRSRSPFVTVTAAQREPRHQIHQRFHGLLIEIGRAHSELQSHVNLVCRLLLEK